MDELKALIAALDRMTAAQNRIAEAVVLLAQATAGEFDDDDGIQQEPIIPGRGMGMNG